MRKLILLLIIVIPHSIYSQDLDSFLDDIAKEEEKKPEFIAGTFEGTTIINGQSLEVAGAGDLNFRISHRFGAINLGLYEFFGMDQASTRLGFEYGIMDIASLSVGRSTWGKTYDTGAKIRLIRQQTGVKDIPVSVTLFSAGYIGTLRWENPERNNLFTSRLSYATQLLIARKFNRNVSLQISPTYVHKNLVPTPEDQNNIFATGLSGKIRVSRKLSFTSEYFYLLPGKTADDFVNSLAFGLDIETGGHVFQLQITNSQAMFTPGFIAETTGNWLDGEIFFGFNLYRVFPLSEKRHNLKW